MKNEIRAMSHRKIEDKISGDLHCAVLSMTKIEGLPWQNGTYCLNWRPDGLNPVKSFHVNLSGEHEGIPDETIVDLLTEAFKLMPDTILSRFELVPDSLHPNNNGSPALAVRKIEVV